MDGWVRLVTTLTSTSVFLLPSFIISSFCRFISFLYFTACSSSTVIFFLFPFSFLTNLLFICLYFFLFNLHFFSSVTSTFHLVLLPFYLCLSFFSFSFILIFPGIFFPLTSLPSFFSFLPSLLPPPTSPSILPCRLIILLSLLSRQTKLHRLQKTLKSRIRSECKDHIISVLRFLLLLFSHVYPILLICPSGGEDNHFLYSAVPGT